MKEHPEVAAKNFFDQGVRLLEAQEFAAAIAPLDAALKLDPTYSDAWCCRALVLGHLKRYAESALAKLGKYREAHASIDRSLQIKPDHANGIYNKGYCYACQGKTTQAVDYIAQAIKMNPAKYLPAAKTDTDLDSLRKNKRFQAIMQG